jgi:hypothetical protein
MDDYLIKMSSTPFPELRAGQLVFRLGYTILRTHQDDMNLNGSITYPPL